MPTATPKQTVLTTSQNRGWLNTERGKSCETGLSALSTLNSDSPSSMAGAEVSAMGSGFCVSSTLCMVVLLNAISTAKYVARNIKKVTKVSVVKKCDCWMCSTATEEKAAASSATFRP